MYLGTARHVAIDWTKCFAYEQLLREEIAHYSQIEVTEELKEGGIHANLAWESWYRYLARRWQTDFGSEIVGAANRFNAPRLLSLGCGYGGMEIGSARQITRPYEMLAVDVNEHLFKAAREEVAREGLHIEFQALDLNFVELAPESFDVVFAHASLHHLLNFEHLFAQVHRALRPGGRLVVLDIIGKTQILFWPENIAFATELVAKLPEHLRHDLPTDSRALFASYLDGANLEGMEGIRQEELEEQLARRFRPLKSFKYNAFVRLICTHPILAPRFDVENASDRECLESLFRLDLEQIESGALRATEMFAVYEKRPDPELAAATAIEVPPQPEPLVSVVLDGRVPEPALRACIAALLAQTHHTLEVLLLAPANAEAAAKVADELRAAGLQVQRIECGEEADADWRQLLATATGDYLAPLDGRDSWYPIKVAELIRALAAQPAAALAFAPAMVVDHRGRRTSQPFGTDILGEDLSADPLARLIGGYELPRSTAVLHAKSCRDLPPAQEPLNERGLVLRLATRNAVAFVGKPLSMLRLVQRGEGEASPVSDGSHLAALERLRRDAPVLGHRLADSSLRAALDRRIEELGGAPPRPRGRLLRLARRLLGHRSAAKPLAPE